MVTRKWKIYGRDGHRQAISFLNSIYDDFSKDGEIRKIEVECADKTGTNDYVIVTITRNSYEDCKAELNGQLSDGIFENANYGKIEEITE